MPKKLSWKPVRKGKIYCSPACGIDCTYVEYLNAVKGAKSLEKELGDGWTGTVWENMGWYFEAEHFEATHSSGIRVYPNGQLYTATLEHFSIYEMAKTPKKAVAKVKKVVKSLMEEFTTLYNAI